MRGILHLVSILGAMGLAACGPAPVPTGISDPFEQTNRQAHEFNRNVDQAVLRPVSRAYGTAIPAPLRQGVSNFAANLDLPGIVLNDILQFRIEDAGANTMRFLFNTTFGLGGVFDLASYGGLYARETDFGETLYRWGMDEGDYVELMLLGPSTERDTVGKIVGFFTNPTRLFIPAPVRQAGTAASVGDVIGKRYQYSDTVDSLLYESADSYAQSRLLYLQNRRFELGRGEEPTYLDPYEDPYAE